MQLQVMDVLGYRAMSGEHTERSRFDPRMGLLRGLQDLIQVRA